MCSNLHRSKGAIIRISEFTLSLLLYRNAPLVKMEFSLSVSLTPNAKQPFVCAFLVRYLRWAVSWPFLLECCSQQSQKNGITERLLLVLRSSVWASHRSKDPGILKETRPWTLVEGHSCPGQDQTDSPVSTVLLLRLWAKPLQMLAPNVVSPLEAFVVLEDCLLHRKTEEQFPSQHSQSVNRGVSSSHQHLLSITSTSGEFPLMTHIWVWHFLKLLYLFHYIKHIQLQDVILRVLFWCLFRGVKRIPLLNNLMDLKRSEILSREWVT